jgi:hypothetical protein
MAETRCPTALSLFPFRGGGAALLFMGFFLSAPTATRAQTPPPIRIEGNLNDAPRPQATAVRIHERIEIDGRLDEAAWALAEPLTELVQQAPRVGEPVSERTVVYFLYDDDRLYIGAEMFDSDPSQIVHTAIERDPNTAQGDVFGFSLDTFLDRRNAYVFFVNPGGAVRDVQSSDDGRVRNLAWDTSWEAKTRIHEGGWTVEMSIPWSSLRFDGRLAEQVWGLNVMRRIRRRTEEAAWAPLDRRWSIYEVSRSGTLGGLSGISPGRNVSLKPYLRSTRPAGTLSTAASAQTEGGVDLKYGVTPSITLDLTFNTDFSQVEVDQPQVNLTRFSLFFPEQRDFFLENASLFQFGDRAATGQRSGASNRDFTLFHSRRIGLTPTGAPLPIGGGGRLTGTAGPISLGLLNMQTQAEGAFAPENFSVARVRGNPHPDLTVGGIFIQRAQTAEGSALNRSYGVDADFTAFNRYLLIESYLAQTEGTRVDGTAEASDRAGRLSVSWRDPLWEMVALYRHLGEDFNPRVGFVRRRGVRHAYGTLGIRPRVAWGWVQELNPYLQTHHYLGLKGGTESREFTGGLDAEFRDGSTLSLSATESFEEVRAPFRSGGVRVEAGAYDDRQMSVAYTFSGGRPLSGGVNLGGGGYYGGTRRSMGATVNGRIGIRAFLNLSAERNRLELPDQPLGNASAYSARLQYFFSPSLITGARFQFDQVAGEWVSDLRLNWVHAPLSDLYLVLTERRDSDSQQVLERLITLKVTRLFPF